jgi:hypothetical protein
VGRWGALRISLRAWAILTVVIIFSLGGAGTGVFCDPDANFLFPNCVGWILLSLASIALGVLFVNLLGAIHLFALFVRQLR